MRPRVVVGGRSTTSARAGLAARLVAATLAVAAAPLLVAGCAAVGEGVGAVGDGFDTLSGFVRDPGDADRVNFKVALNATKRGNYAAAARAYQRMYDNTGHPYAALQLGRYHADGRGVPRDPAKAAEFFRASYEKNWRGQGEAAYGLARLYDTGEGVPADKDRAHALYSFAFEQGVTSAAFPLAKAYDEGAPVAPDRTWARTLYEVAAGAGEARAALRLAEIRLEDGASPAQARAVARPGVAWLRELAKQDNDWAEMRLAAIYQEGRLAEADQDLAERYLRDAAKHGNGTANARLAERAEQAGDAKRAMGYWRRAAEAGHPSGMVRVGQADLQDGRTAEGLALLERAVDLGHPSAMVEIGRRKLAGDGLPADAEGALALLDRAAGLGHPSAMYALGQAYADGTGGVRRSRAKAREWLEKARAAGHPSAAKALAGLEAGEGGVRS